MKILISILFVIVFTGITKAFPRPDEEVDGTTIIATDKCDAQEFEAFVEKLVNCLDTAQRSVDEAILSGGDFERALCLSIGDQLDCFDTISAECFDKERQVTRRNNFLIEQFEKANNNSDFLGQKFIDGCPTLSQNEEDLVKLVSGSSKCSYTEYENSFTEYKSCIENAASKRDNALALIDFVSDKLSLYVRSKCNFRGDWIGCQSLATNCLGEDEAQAIIDKDDELFKEDEYNIQTNLEIDFSYSGSC